MKKNSPFDAIHVGAAAEKVPKALTDQLAVGGRLLIPVDDHYSGGQNYLQIDKQPNGSLTQTNLMGVQYVRLVHPKEEFKDEEDPASTSSTEKASTASTPTSSSTGSSTGASSTSGSRPEPTKL